jgi:hypothetical protein
MNIKDYVKCGNAPLGIDERYGSPEECLRQAMIGAAPKTVKFHDFTTISKIGTLDGLWPLYYQGLAYTSETPLEVGSRMFSFGDRIIGKGRKKKKKRNKK